jgi:hypothetical protein
MPLSVGRRFYIRLFGASHVLMELERRGDLCHEPRVPRRATNCRIRAATMASLLYACHSLVFRYHVWARECS